MCLFGLQGCTFAPPPPLLDGPPPFDAAPDAAPDAMVDAAPACEANTIVCDDTVGRYIECDGDGTAVVAIDCPLGCAAAIEKCIDVLPSNNLAPYLDQALSDPGVVPVTFTGVSTINTGNGIVLVDGQSVEIPNVVVDDTRIFMAKSLDVSGTLKITGAYMVAFAVDGDVTITGLVDVSGDGSTRGPGGYQGGGHECTGVSSSGATPTAGGGGGGRYDAGGGGGSAGNGEVGGAGGMQHRDADLVPLEPGCSGNLVLEGTVISEYGGGGGAIHIVSRTQIALRGSGVIDASGGGARSATIATGTVGGAGGGSGGGVLLEAPQVVLDGASVVISTRGGGGAAAGSGAAAHHGHDGGLGPAAAAGGVNTSGADGGAGGTEVSPPVAGQAGAATADDGGGGGGSVGQTRFNTSTQSPVILNGALVRSRSSSGYLATRHVP